MTDLEQYCIFEGPFDFITGSSLSASLAASLLIRKAQENPEQEPLFKGAVFFSGITPFDYKALSKHEIQLLDPARDGVLLTLPTANIWRANDERHAAHSSILSQLCSPETNINVVHEAAGMIPGAGAEEYLVEAAHAFRRTVDRAITVF